VNLANIYCLFHLDIKMANKAKDLEPTDLKRKPTKVKPVRRNMKFTGRTPAPLVNVQQTYGVTSTAPTGDGNVDFDPWEDEFSGTPTMEGSDEDSGQLALNSTTVTDNDPDYDPESRCVPDNDNPAGDEADNDDHEEGEFSCPTCSKILPTKSRLNQHMVFCPQMIQDSSLVTCSECPRVFISNGALERHVDKQEHVRKCQLCI